MCIETTLVYRVAGISTTLLRHTLVGEMIQRKGEVQDELGNMHKKFMDFVIKPEEKMCSGIARLNGIVHKLTQHDQPPTDAAK